MSVDSKIVTYKESLEYLDRQEKEKPSWLRALTFDKDLLNVLAARDSVSHAIKQYPLEKVEDIRLLIELDNKLRSRASQIQEQINPSVFFNWRETLQPESSKWWWFLDKRIDTSATQPNPFLLIISIILMTLAISIALSTAATVMSYSVDFIKVSSTLFPFLVSLLAGISFTELGRRVIEHVTSKFSKTGDNYHMGSLGFALVLLIVTVLGRWMIPATVGQIYLDEGISLHNSGLPDAAIEKYNLAVTLFPSSSNGKFNALAHLANAYEDKGQFDKSIEQYQEVLKQSTQSDNSDGAKLEMTRIYIWRLSEGDKAISIIDQLSQSRLHNSEGDSLHGQTSSTSKIDLSLLSCLRCWALFASKKFEDAEVCATNLGDRNIKYLDDFRTSSWSHPEVACLMAEILDIKSKQLADFATSNNSVKAKNELTPEQANNKKQAIKEWKQCYEWTSFGYTKYVPAGKYPYPYSEQNWVDIFNGWHTTSEKQLDKKAIE
jgi:tetratricopeptide (TPR) repeat protein